MTVQRIGVAAEFDIASFAKGLDEYLNGLRTAEQATEAFAQGTGKLGTAIADALKDATRNLREVTKGYQDLTRSVNQAAAAQQSAVGKSAQLSLREEARVAALLKQELREVLIERRANATAALQEATAYQKRAAALEIRNIQARRAVRRDELEQLDPNALFAFDSLLRVQTEVKDLGRQTFDSVRKQAEFQRLVTQEVRDRVREERASLVLQDAQASALDRVRARMEQAEIAARRLARNVKAADLGQSLDMLEEVRRTQVTRGDLKLKPEALENAERQLRVNQLISAELSDHVELARLRYQQDNSALTAVERQRNALAQQAIELRRAARDAQALRDNIDAQRLRAVRRTPVEDADLGRSATEQLEKQLRINALLGQELSDRVAQERARLELANRTITAYQRQAAVLRLQQIDLNRQRRDVEFGTLGVDPAQVQGIRAMRVAMRDMQDTGRNATREFAQLRTTTVALGVALGTAAVQGVQALVNAFARLGSQLLETIRFFERFDLSVQFFAGRAARAADESLNYADSLRVGAERARELSIWLQQLAINSPFTTKDVATIFRTAQAYGLTLEETQSLTPKLLDFAAAAGLNIEILERLALAFGQVRSRGKLTGEEIRQLGNSALPVRDILVRALGIANEEFDKLVESGALVSNITLPALINALDEFKGAGETVATKTVSGLIASFRDLAEVGIARFFLKAIEPFKEGINELFGALRDQRNLAFAEILGKEIGTRLKFAFDRIQGYVRGIIQAWSELDPLVKRQVVIFGVAFAAFITLIGAIGLLGVALGVLKNPFVQIAIALAYLVSLWGTGFATIRKQTEGFVRFWTDVTTSIAGAFEWLGEQIENFVTFSTGLLTRFTRFATDFAVGFMNAYASGISSGSSAVADAAGAVTNSLAYWFKPGSPPRVAPDIDQWGYGLGVEYVSGAATGIQKSVKTRITDQIPQWMKPALITDQLRNFLVLPEPTLNDIGRAALLIDRIGASAKLSGKEVAKLGDSTAASADRSVAVALGRQYKNQVGQMQQAIRDDLSTGRRGAMVDAITAQKPAVEKAAQDLGQAAAQAFSAGWNVPKPRQTISEELQAVLDKIGSGPRLRPGDIEPFVRSTELFNEDDFTFFGEIAGAAGQLLSVFEKLGDLSDVDLIRTVFGSRTEIAAAVAEFRRSGQVSESLIGRIAAAAGPAGEQVTRLVRSFVPLAAANNQVNNLQEQLNDLTKQYVDILRPLKSELQDISDLRKKQDEELEILSLRRTINNQAVSDFRREQARTRIREIELGARVRGIERERDARLEAVETELELAKEEQKRRQTDFDLIRRQIAARAEQLGLVADELGIFKKLEEEAQKIREKQKSDLEKQLELLRLQQAEFKDSVTLAKARYTLASAESTELERQNALLDIANVELSRRERILKATELGFGPEDLQFIYDIPVTLKDIGKEGKGDLFENLNTALDDSEQQIREAAENFNRALFDARTAVENFLTTVREGLIETNNNLPLFLRFLSTDEEEAPILNTLRKLGDALLWIGIILIAMSVLRNLMFLRGLLGALLFGAGMGGGGAAGGGLGGLVGLLLRIGEILVWLLPMMWRLVAYVRYLGPLGLVVGFGVGAVNFMEQDAQKNLADAVEDFQDQKIALGDALEVGKLEIPSSLPQQLQDQMRAILQNALVDDKAYLETVYADLGNAVSQGIAQGILDMNDARTRDAVNQFFNDLTEIFAEVGQIRSPSELMAARIGVPLGRGVIEGIKRVFTESEAAAALSGMDTFIVAPFSRAVDGVAATASDLRTRLGTTFTTIRSGTVLRVRGMSNDVRALYTGLSNDILLLANLLRTNLAREWTGIRTDAETQVRGLRSDITVALRGLATDLLPVRESVKTAVVKAFTEAKEESLAQIMELVESIIEVFDGGAPGATGGVVSQVVVGVEKSGTKIGEAFVGGMAAGITGDKSKEVLTKAVQTAVRQAFSAAALEMEIGSPSKRAARELGLPYVQGVVQGIDNGLALLEKAGGQVGAALLGAMSPVSSLYSPSRTASQAGNVSNVSRINNYNLNVTSDRASQGIIYDFAVMKASAF